MELSANLANLGKYTAGTLTDTVLFFPTTKEQVQSPLRSIGVDGLRYSEFIVTQYSANVSGLAQCLEEYPNLDELNYLAHQLEGMTPSQKEKYSAALRHGEYGGSLPDLINLTYNLDCYEFLPEVKSYEDYGRYLVDNGREFRLPPKAGYYFDYAAYGDDTIINEGGDITPWGYIYNHRKTPFRQVYTQGQCPKEYKVFQYPLQSNRKAPTSQRSRDSPIR